MDAWEGYHGTSSLYYICLNRFFPSFFSGSFILHFTGVIECIILIDRLKNFNSFVKRVFTISPKKITLILFGVSLIIDFFPIFQYSAFGFDYNYYTSDGQLNTYVVYFSLTSNIAASSFGSIVEVIVFVIRDGVTLTFSITLNILCLIEIKKQIAKKQLLTSITNMDTWQPVLVNDLRKSREQIYQNNMTQLTVTLVVISSLVRITTLTCGIYWLFAFDLISAVLGVSADTAQMLNSTVSFFVYLRFNRKYRKIFLDLIFGPVKTNANNKTKQQITSARNIWISDTKLNNQ